MDDDIKELLYEFNDTVRWFDKFGNDKWVESISPLETISKECIFAYLKEFFDHFNQKAFIFCENEEENEKVAYREADYPFFVVTFRIKKNTSFKIESMFVNNFIKKFITLQLLKYINRLIGKPFPIIYY